MAGITSGSVPTFGSLAFTLADLSGATHLTALYDTYRFVSVVLEFSPTGIQMVTSPYSSAGQNVPFFYCVIDYNDAAIPTSIAELQQYSTCKTVLSTRPLRFSLTPRYLTMVFNGVLSTAYALGSSGQWLAGANAAIPHYGIKWALSPDPGAGEAGRFHFNLRAKYTIQFNKRK